MEQYLELCRDVLKNGTVREDRTGTGTIAVFGRQLRFDLREGFPLLTTKKMHYPAIFHELFWMLSGSTNIQYLKDNNVRIWNEWADEDGEVGPLYGTQWRAWLNPHTAEIHPHGVAGGYAIQYGIIDQLQWAINTIKQTPHSRRIVVSSWNPSDIPLMALPPCHIMYQFYVENGRLSTLVYQRSADVFLGLPFDIASYALLTHLVAHVTGLKVGELIYTLGDTHIYSNHLFQIGEQIKRVTRDLPRIYVNRHDREILNINDFTYDDLEVLCYNPHPALKGEVSV